MVVIKRRMSVTKGYLILAPCGAGKSTWISNLSLQEKKKWLDGDDLLVTCGVKNRNYFWYTKECQLERNQINEIFNTYLNQGFHILYSGNPKYMTADLLIIPDDAVRWERLLKRSANGGYMPDHSRFNEESDIYRTYTTSIPTFEGDIPSLEIIIAMLTS